MTFPSKRQAVLEEVECYNKAHWFLEQLMRSKSKLSSQQYSTLKGQALSGDLEGAWKGLKKLLRAVRLRKGRTVMPDREKVIKGLECHRRATYGEVDEYGLACNTCPYKDTEITCQLATGGQLIEDAIALLKAQEPRVMTLEELSTWDGAFLIETKKGGIITWSTYHGEYEQSEDIICRLIDADGGVDDRIKRMYGHVWRCWTSRPTDEQRKTVKWDE